jgi:hypothetical protein
MRTGSAAAAAQMSKLPKYCSLLTSLSAGRSTQAKCRSTIHLILLPEMTKLKLKEEIIKKHIVFFLCLWLFSHTECAQTLACSAPYITAAWQFKCTL